jgi:hypothetical protein
MAEVPKRRRFYRAQPKYKYAVFAGDDFYPTGGFHDFYGFAYTFAEALALRDEALSEKNAKSRTDWFNEERSNCPCDWAHVVNLKKKKIIA